MTDDAEEPPSFEGLDKRLRAARQREADRAGGTGPSGENAGSGIGLGFRLAIDLVAGVAVGTFIGYALDRWLGTRPWLLVVFFFLGACAGAMNVYRTAKGLDSSVGFGQASRRKDGVGEDGSGGSGG